MTTSTIELPAPDGVRTLAGEPSEPRATLEDLVLGAWEDLAAHGRADCPVCHGPLERAGCAVCGAGLS